MPRKRGRRRSKHLPPKIVWEPGTPEAVTRAALRRSRSATGSPHGALARLWKIRDRWLAKADRPHYIPPGALCRQKAGRPIPPWTTAPDGRLPKALGFCSVYAICNLKNRKAFVGHTLVSPYVRFYEHMGGSDSLGQAIREKLSHFAVLLLEKVPVLPRSGVGPLKSTMSQRRAREISWINRLDTRARGYNEPKVEEATPLTPLPPSRGLGVRSSLRPRQPSGTASSGVRVHRTPTRLSSRDWRKRVGYLTTLLNNKGYLVHSCMPGSTPGSLHCTSSRFRGHTSLSDSEKRKFRRLQRRANLEF